MIPKITKDLFFCYREASSGVVGIFDDANKLIDAAKKVKEKNYTGFDCFTPYPVHGLDSAMGISRSGIPWVTFFMGAIGCALGFLYPYLTHQHDWQINFSGKSMNAWPAYVPIIFEATVFMAAICSVLALALFSGFGKFFRKPIHPEITSHKFAIWIPGDSANYNESEASNFLKSIGSIEVQVIKPENKA